MKNTNLVLSLKSTDLTLMKNTDLVLEKSEIFITNLFLQI